MRVVLALFALMMLSSCNSVPDGYKDDWTPEGAMKFFAQQWMFKPCKEPIHVPDW